MKGEQPLACNLSAINSDELDDHNQNGGMYLPAGSFIAWERLCCPFFHFALEVTPGHGPIWLTLTRNEDIKQFVAHNILPQWGTGDNTV